MKTFMRRTLLGLGGLFILLALFHLVENWRGSRAWKAWQQEQEAAGFNFDRASYAPPLIPDEENFAAAPRIAAAINGTGGLVTLPKDLPSGPNMRSWEAGRAADLEVFRAVFKDGDLHKGLEENRINLDDIERAAARPGCRLAFDYAHFPEAEIPLLVGFRASAKLIQLRALVALREGRQDAAFRDVNTLLQMSDHFGKQPILLSQLLDLAVAGLALQPIWEGLDSHAWTEAQLASLRGMLAKVDFLGSMLHAWEFEAAGMSASKVALAKKAPWAWTPAPDIYAYSDGPVPPSRATRLFRQLAFPWGWILQGAVRGERVFKETVRDPIDGAAHRIDPRRQDAALQAHAKPGRGPYSIFAADAAPALASQNIRAARLQAIFVSASLGCDLERYHRARGLYPEQLSDLGVMIPADVIGGQSLHYRRSAEGGYLLYSVGWNGKDDGGRVGQGKDPLWEGDWVWAIHGGAKLSRAPRRDP